MIYFRPGALYPSIYLPSGTNGKVYPWMDSAYYKKFVTTIVQQTVQPKTSVPRLSFAFPRRPSIKILFQQACCLLSPNSRFRSGSIPADLFFPSVSAFCVSLTLCRGLCCFESRLSFCGIHILIAWTALQVLLSKQVAAASGETRPPVYPFAWSKYHNGASHAHSRRKDSNVAYLKTKSLLPGTALFCVVALCKSLQSTSSDHMRAFVIRHNAALARGRRDRVP